MRWVKGRWPWIVLGTTLTLVSMGVGLSLLRYAAGYRGASDEERWMAENPGAWELPMQRSTLFEGYVKAYPDGRSPHGAELRRALREGGEATFARMARLGPPGARLYGLCGLRALGSARLPDSLALAAADERRVALVYGCSLWVREVREAVQSPGFWAMCDDLAGRGP